jgi:hypothetical protein
MKIWMIARQGGLNCDGVPLGLVNWMIVNRRASHDDTRSLQMCPETREVHDVIFSYNTEQGPLHVCHCAS